MRNRKSFICTRLLWIIFASLFLWHHSNAQPSKKFSGTSYGVREGLLSGHVFNLVEDSNGFLWVSTGVGLQRFDGKTFETVSSQAGLPQTSHLAFFKLKNGNFWLYDENGISVYETGKDKFVRVTDFSRNNLAPAMTGLIPLVETGKGVWCRYASQKRFICINQVSGKIEDTLSIPDNMQPSTNIYAKGFNNTLIYSAVGIMLVELDFSQKKIIHFYRSKSIDQHFSACTPLSATDVLVTSQEGISRVNLARGIKLFTARYPKIGAVRIQNISLTSMPDGFLVLSLNNQLFAVNGNNGKILYQIVDQQNDLFVDPGYIINCIADHYYHLWVVSTAEGLKKINLNNLGIRYYGFGKLPLNFNRCIFADKKANTIITGSLFNGFSIFDTTQRLIKHFSLANDAQASCILKVQPSKYLLFASGEPSVYLLDSKKLNLTPLPATPFKTSDILYQTYAQTLSDSTAALFCNQSYFIVNFSNSRIHFTKHVINEEFSGAIIDHKNRIWLGETGKYFVLGAKDLTKKTGYYLPDKVKVQCFMEDPDKNMWVGTEKGLYEIQTENGTIIEVYKKKDGLANDCIYSIVNDKDGTIWCGTNRGISAIYRSGKIINVYSSDGLQGDEFNTNSYAKTDGNELFFGGINGVNSFYPDSIQKIGMQPKILMTGIQVMDVRLEQNPAFATSKITLPYSKNTIAFAFTALGRYSPDEYTYQYKMSSVDKGWVNGGNRGYARYALPPGKYIFEYTAGNAPARNLQHKKFISITITPPVWRRGWFVALIGLIIILLVIGILNLFYRSMSRETLRRLEIQRTLQLERERISRDLHDNIGAYTTVLIASVESLAQEKPPLIFDQRAHIIAENAKNIVASLNETIWILNNDAITITDFIDRFKLYAIKTGRNFPETKLIFKEDLANNWILSPSESLGLFRIMQEILQNAFKHARAKYITISIHSNHHFFITIKDDGVGFDPGCDYAGNGLANIKFRAKEAGYSISITSTEMLTETTLQKTQPVIV